MSQEWHLVVAIHQCPGALARVLVGDLEAFDIALVVFVVSSLLLVLGAFGVR